jgi:hypothetical protein
MPYTPNVSDDTAHAVARYLLSIAYRPWETDDDDAWTATFDRKLLWDTYGADSPVTRREDFYEALRILAEHPDYADQDAAEDDDVTRAITVKNGGARRVHVVIALDGDLYEAAFRDFADSEAWIDAGGYDAAVARELLEELGFDLDTELSDAHRVIPKGREHLRIEHDPSAPRRCSKCGEVKATHYFARRGVEGTPGYARFQSHCIDCKLHDARAFRKARPGYDTRRRSAPQYSPRFGFESR